MMDEYRLVPGFLHYRACTDGRVQSKHGETWRTLLPSYDRHGHGRIWLCSGGVRTRRFIHEIVLSTFVGPCPSGLECRHLNDKPGENFLSNLKWGRRGGCPDSNMADRVRNGGGVRGERNPMALLSDSLVHIIRIRASHGEDLNRLAAEFGVQKSTLYGILFKNTWAHVA